jgi:hypothetical protein
MQGSFLVGMKMIFKHNGIQSAILYCKISFNLFINNILFKILIMLIMIFNIFLFYNFQIVQWAFLWMDQCIQWETYLKMKWDDDECVEKKRKMKIFDFVIIHNCKGVYLFLTLNSYSILIFILFVWYVDATTSL